jgi:hypothetical protein
MKIAELWVQNDIDMAGCQNWVCRCACQRNNVSRRGIFSASRPPTNEKELNTLYFEGSRAMYSNLPCPGAYMASDGTHAIVSLRETVSSFLALGIDDLRFDPAQLEDPSSSYFSSLAAKTINRQQPDTLPTLS